MIAKFPFRYVAEKLQTTVITIQSLYRLLAECYRINMSILIPLVCATVYTVEKPTAYGIVATTIRTGFLLGEMFSTIQRKPSTMDCPLLYTTISNLYDDIKLYFDILRIIFRIRIE
jgi:hypothetical protein